MATTKSRIASTVSAGLTPEEFLRLYGDEKYVELVRGEAIQLTPTGISHTRTERRVLLLLDAFVTERDLGEVCPGDAGFILEREPGTVRSPDVAFVSKAKTDALQDETGYYPFAPDLAVEILSPNDSLRATEAKARMYLRAGASVVWILDPSEKTLRIYRPGAEPALLGSNEEAEAEPALPGFRRLVGDLFGTSTLR